MQVDILDFRSQRKLCTLESLDSAATISDVKREYHKKFPKSYPERQSFRLEPRGKSLKDEDKLASFDIKDGGRLYFKDLGPQISWRMVFLAEYASPLIFYVLLYPRPSIVYGAAAASKPYAPVVHIAAACWAGHFAKRLLETLFVHRFSHATMPLFNLFKNCAYYGGYGVLVGYFVNHPLYTPPMFGDAQVYTGLALFLFNEYGNFVIHCALRDLRPPGTKERKIPYPTSHPLTQLFRFVSCPNYTYEAGSWIAFSVMTQTLTAVLFTLFGFYQMAVWAIGKHRNYRKEFKDYPKGRKAIVPILL
ncbi:very-long-chain enoyl-CoA reductase-like isoform X1 [Porites lutea]|uniref:very-long-chain enoyl-CoA reductase-like isoform X1 n=1 Tax=Porites lutea TaxID=51062 RepID=UPI003CC6A348